MIQWFKSADLNHFGKTSDFASVRSHDAKTVYGNCFLT